jgi:hypothetical protein
VPLQVALNKTNQGKPFWESGDEIDVGFYAEVLVTVFRFLPEEESIPILVTCLEPERSEAVKMAVARAGLMLALEVRSLSKFIDILLTKFQAKRLPWQKGLLNFALATSRRFRDIYKVSIMSRLPSRIAYGSPKAVGTHRNEQDQYGNSARAASRPKARRYASDMLSDRELLLLSILSMWRSDPIWFMMGLDKTELEEWLPASARVWDSSLDITVKISASTNLLTICDTIFDFAFPDEVFEPFAIYFERGALVVFFFLG